MTASARILDHFSKANGSEPIRILGASGQLGYGVPTPAFSAGLERKPHLIGCDMGSIDIGPYYLGSGELATAPAATRRDLRKVLLGALKLKIPLIIGSVGSAGAKPHLEQTLAIIREIAREEGLGFRMGVLRADIDRTAKLGKNSENSEPIFSKTPPRLNWFRSSLRLLFLLFPVQSLRCARFKDVTRPPRAWHP
jgi:hypothetical protein